MVPFSCVRVVTGASTNCALFPENSKEFSTRLSVWISIFTVLNLFWKDYRSYFKYILSLLKTPIPIILRYFRDSF
ncbi:hypothetical protein LEP1GSC188_2870 [Leptospira weilii serovar Topaz str. LT2116]|uniref:Uncharacterized protein n=1 Tax=Leptospira weilii serovar Topaz str. LT2116 TaxID=1088540 RepID=M3G9U6_9LEPT|nr:hypothetical protein LEP1GSC188_2870 [Leptospira weilii serovar Topaz str. LT2116]